MTERKISIEAQCLNCAQSRTNPSWLDVETWADKHANQFGHTVEVTRVSQREPDSGGSA